MLGGHNTNEYRYEDLYKDYLQEHQAKPDAVMLFATRCALRMWDLISPPKQMVARAEPLTQRLYGAIEESVDLAVKVCQARDDAVKHAFKTQAQTLIQFLAAFNLGHRQAAQGLTQTEVNCGIAAESLALCITNYYSPRGAALTDNAAKVAAYGEEAVNALQVRGLGLVSDLDVSNLHRFFHRVNLFRSTNYKDRDKLVLAQIELPADPGDAGPLGPLWPENAPSPAESSDLAATFFQLLNRRLDQLHEGVIEDFQKILIHRLAGRSFGSFEDNQAVAAAIQDLLNRLGVRVKCPRCGEPARLRCVAAPRMPGGSFELEHYAQGRLTRHGGFATLPRLELVPAPSEPDRRRRRTIEQGSGSTKTEV